METGHFVVSSLLSGCCCSCTCYLKIVVAWVLLVLHKTWTWKRERQSQCHLHKHQPTISLICWKLWTSSNWYPTAGNQSFEQDSTDCAFAASDYGTRIWSSFMVVVVPPAKLGSSSLGSQRSQASGSFVKVISVPGTWCWSACLAWLVLPANCSNNLQN